MPIPSSMGSRPVICVSRRQRLDIVPGPRDPSTASWVDAAREPGHPIRQCKGTTAT